MKNLIYILFILFPIGKASTTFAQTCELRLDDILKIDSQQNFERVLIENNFQRANPEELGWKGEVEDISMKNSMLLVYGFEGWTKYYSSPQTILSVGTFPKKSKTNLGDNFKWMFVISNPEDKYSIYSIVFSEVKEKCKFVKIYNTDDGESAAFYNCPNASFKGKIGFFIENDNGFIKLENSKFQNKETGRKNLDAMMGGISDGEGDDNKPGDKGKNTGDPNASGYYGSGGGGSIGNYRLDNRKAVSKPKPTYDCNEEGKVYVSISVDKSGRVFTAKTGIKGTTNSAPCPLQRAKEAALKTRFNSDNNAPSKQIGTIIYNFSLSDKYKSH